jgi:hypothetical protein
MNSEPVKTDAESGLAFLACFVTLVLIFMLPIKVAALRLTSWEELLLVAVAPPAVTCGTLYLAHWHQEMSRAARALRVLGETCLIFGAALVMAAIACVTLYVLLYRFSAFHY